VKLETARLVLKPPVEEDIPSIVAVASDWQVAKMVLVPHPYFPSHAQTWIEQARESWREHGIGALSVFTRQGQAFIGAIGLKPTTLDDHASAGYWFCPSVWGRGFATEALRELIRYGFEVRKLLRIEAGHLLENTASGRVMEKVGMGHAVRVDLPHRDDPSATVSGIMRYIHAWEWEALKAA